MQWVELAAQLAASRQALDLSEAKVKHNAEEIVALKAQLDLANSQYQEARRQLDDDAVEQANMRHKLHGRPQQMFACSFSPSLLLRLLQRKNG